MPVSRSREEGDPNRIDPCMPGVRQGAGYLQKTKDVYSGVQANKRPQTTRWLGTQVTVSSRAGYLLAVWYQGGSTKVGPAAAQDNLVLHVVVWSLYYERDLHEAKLSRLREVADAAKENKTKRRRRRTSRIPPWKCPRCPVPAKHRTRNLARSSRCCPSGRCRAMWGRSTGRRRREPNGAGRPSNALQRGRV